MTKSKIIAGIELGSDKIATIVAQLGGDDVSGNTISIVGVSSVSSKGIRKGQIVDIEEAVEAAVTSVEAAERMAGYNLDSVYVAVGGAHVHSQNSHGVVAVSEPDGEIASEDVDRVIEAAAAISIPQSRERIHVLPSEFIVDGESGVNDPVGMSGVRLEVETHIVTAASAAIKNVKKAVNELGISPVGMVFSGLAAAYAVLTDTEKELGCAVIDVGGGTTSIAVFIDGALSYSSVIPIGAKNVTNDLAIGLRVSLETAEKIKIMLSDSYRKKQKIKEGENEDSIDLTSLGLDETKKISRKTLVEGIIKPRLNEIFSMVKLELDRAGVSHRIPSGAVICGGGAETVGAVESAKRTLMLPVRIGIPKGVSGLVDDVVNPAFAVPVGLILYAAGESPTREAPGSGKKIKLPTGNLFGRLFGVIKNLLP